MLFTLLGNFGSYSLLQHGHFVFFPTYCVVWTIISIDIKSLATSSVSIVLHPHAHVATFDTFTTLSGFLHTTGADLLWPFSLPGFLSSL